MTQHWLNIGLALFVGAVVFLHTVSASEKRPIPFDNASIENILNHTPFPGAPALPVSTFEEERDFFDLPIAFHLASLQVEFVDQPLWRSLIPGEDFQRRLERPPQPVCC